MTTATTKLYYILEEKNHSTASWLSLMSKIQ